MHHEQSAFTIEKVKDRNNNIIKVAKQMERKYSLFVNDMLINWIAVKKLGIVADCEIYCGPKYIIFVQKLWQKDILCYLIDYKIAIKHNTDATENIFTNIHENVALFMKIICPKLKTVHDKSIIFVDIKPGNMVMDYEEKTNKLIDAGIIDFECLRKTKNNCRNDAVGTRYYQAPEVNAHGYKLTTKYDIFGLGLTVLEMMTTKHPLDKRGKYVKGNPIKKQEIDDVMNECELLKEEKHQQLKDLLNKMLSISLEDRYDINQVMNHSWYTKYCN